LAISVYLFNTMENKYAIDGDDLIHLRVAAKGLIRELEELNYIEGEIENSLKTYRKNRIIELKEILQKTDFYNLQQIKC